LFDTPLDDVVVGDLRAATNGGWAFGGADFRDRIAEMLGRRVVPLPRGRPLKETTEEKQPLLL